MTGRMGIRNGHSTLLAVAALLAACFAACFAASFAAPSEPPLLVGALRSKSSTEYEGGGR